MPALPKALGLGPIHIKAMPANWWENASVLLEAGAMRMGPSGDKQQVLKKRKPKNDTKRSKGILRGEG